MKKLEAAQQKVKVQRSLLEKKSRIDEAPTARLSALSPCCYAEKTTKRKNSNDNFSPSEVA